MGLWARIAVAAAVSLASTGASRAYDVATMHPGCQQQRSWCERAAAVSYGDQARFRNALSVVIAREWVRMVEAAQKVSSVEGHGVHSPSVEEITADLIQAWRIGSSCCEVALRPALDGAARAVEPVDYEELCRGAGPAAAGCVAAIKASSPAAPR
jgi:hypothetical protein